MMSVKASTATMPAGEMRMAGADAVASAPAPCPLHTRSAQPGECVEQGFGPVVHAVVICQTDDVDTGGREAVAKTRTAAECELLPRRPDLV